MSEQILTLVITEPATTPTGGLMVRMLTLDQHGCEVGWYSLDTAGHGYGPSAEHPDRDLFGWPEGIDQPFSFYNNVDEGWAVPSVEAGVEAAAYEQAERMIERAWDFTTECARPDEDGDDCADCDELAHERAARVRLAMSTSAAPVVGVQAPVADRLVPRSASVELQHLGDRFVAYRVVVKVADEFGFVEERHVWNGCSRDEGERAAEIARKTLGAVNGLTVVSR